MYLPAFKIHISQCFRRLWEGRTGLAACNRVMRVGSSDLEFSTYLYCCGIFSEDETSGRCVRVLVVQYEDEDNITELQNYCGLKRKDITYDQGHACLILSGGLL